MVENLRLVGSKLLTANDSDVTSSYTLPASSADDWCQTLTEAGCVNTANVLYSGHSEYGTYYSWRAATAGTGTYSVESGDAISSVCPKGWRLPTGGSSGDFDILYNNYNSYSAIMDTPASYVLSGRYSDASPDDPLQGSRSYEWTSTAVDSGYVYVFAVIKSSTTVYPVISGWKIVGNPVRCVVR